MAGASAILSILYIPVRSVVGVPFPTPAYSDVGARPRWRRRLSILRPARVDLRLRKPETRFRLRLLRRLLNFMSPFAPPGE